MSNKQIHELRKLDKLDFNPTTDNFLVQKKGGGTYKSSITHLIDSPSANLPGTKSWAWNWLDEPEDLIGYRGTFRSGSAYTSKGGAANFSEKIKASWLQKEVDGKKEASSIPSSARSVLMTSFTRDCSLKIYRARSTPIQNIKILPNPAYISPDSNGNYASYQAAMRNLQNAWVGGASGPNIGGDGMPMENLFIVDHVGIPQDRRKGYGESVSIDEGSQVTFQISTTSYRVIYRSDSVRRLSTKESLSLVVNSHLWHSELFYIKMLAWA